MRGKVEDHGHLIRMMCRSCHAPLRTDKQSTVFIASLRYLDVDVFLYILYSKLILWLCSSFPRRAHTRCSPPHVAVIQHYVRAAHQYIIRAQRNRLGLRVAAKRDSWKAAGSLPFKPSFADAADFWPRRTGRRLIGCPVPLSPRSRCASKTCRPCRSSFRLLPGDWQKRRKTGPKTSSTCSFFWFASRPSLLETRTRQNRQPALAICPTRAPFPSWRSSLLLMHRSRSWCLLQRSIQHSGDYLLLARLRYARAELLINIGEVCLFAG